MNRNTRALNDLKLQQAIRWISNRLQDEPATPRGMLIDEAGQEFSLSPRQEDFLQNVYLGPEAASVAQNTADRSRH
jgi:hypothetical protein